MEANIKQREKHKDVTIETDIGPRTFRIYKWDAQTAMFMLLQVLSKLVPMVPLELDEMINKFAGDTSVKLSKKSEMTKTEFVEFTNACLMRCSECVSGNYIPVLRDNGTYGVSELEDDYPTVTALIAHTLIFNLKGFFSEKLLMGLKINLPNIP